MKLIHSLSVEEGGASVLGLKARAPDYYPWRAGVEESKARKAVSMSEHNR
jgi:hypothetical protein